MLPAFLSRYDEHIQFQDPLQRVSGLAAYAELNRCFLARARRVEISVEELAEQEGRLFASWRMRFAPRLGPELTLEGVSHLRVREGRPGTTRSPRVVRVTLSACCYPLLAHSQTSSGSGRFTRLKHMKCGRAGYVALPQYYMKPPPQNQSLAAHASYAAVRHPFRRLWRQLAARSCRCDRTASVPVAA